MKIEELAKKKVLILGFGKEGQESYLFLRKKFPKKTILIADKKNFSEFSEKEKKLLKKDNFLKIFFGKNYLKSLSRGELIIKTPGIPFWTIEPFLKKGSIITSETEIFFENCQGTIIGVTGTKGKGTTSSLIFNILKKANFKVALIGNIGKPALKFLAKAKKDSFFVYELSAQQLSGLRISPKIALFLNIFPAHLDYFKSFKNYFLAKANIFLWQKENDFFLYNKNQKIIEKFASKSKAKKIPILKPERILKKYKIKKIPLKGKHNLVNIAFALKVGEIFNIPGEILKEGIESFKPLAHRLEYVGNFKGIDFYNDSLATVPEATKSAIEAFKEKISVLILGGVYIKGVNLFSIVEAIFKKKIKNIIILEAKKTNFAQIGKKIEKEILKIAKEKNFLPKIYFTDSIKEAVRLALLFGESKTICLLSPGAPSFNLFANYRERGNLFKKYLKIYGKNFKKKKKH